MEETDKLNSIQKKNIEMRDLLTKFLIRER